MTTIQLVVGLGNPGSQYQHSRHNCGFMVVDLLARQWGIPLKSESRFQSLYGEGMQRGQKCRLLEPQTFMNLSGQAVQAVLSWYKFSPENILVVYDDMDLPLGKMRLRGSGSPGGHNGIKSLIQHLGTDRFPRLRIGVGHPGGKKEVVKHVLGSFGPEEKTCLETVLTTSQQAIETVMFQDLSTAMNRFNALDCCQTALSPRLEPVSETPASPARNRSMT